MLYSESDHHREDIDKSLQWLDKLQAASREKHDNRSLSVFLDVLKDPPCPFVGEWILKKTDFDYVIQRMHRKIKRSYEEKDGVKIYVHYQAGFSLLYLVTLLKNII